MSSLDQAFIKAYMQQGAAVASPASAPRAMPLADALVEHERQRSRGRAKVSLDGVMGALQIQPRSPAEPPPKPAPLPAEPEVAPDASGSEWFLPPTARKTETAEPEVPKSEPNDPAKPIATLADFGITGKTYRVDEPAAPAAADATGRQTVPPPHLGVENRESPAAAALGDESGIATGIETGNPRDAHRLEPEAYSTPLPLVLPFRPLLQVDRFVWPPVCTRLAASAGAQLDRLCEALVAAKDRGQKALAIAACRAGEGATTLLLCAARRLSERGLRVAMIDADPHDPQLARRFGLQIERGWEAALSGQLPLAEVAVESADRRLLLLPLCKPRDAAGAFPHDPSAAAECIATLVAEYDLVLIDLGPLERLAGGKTIPRGIAERLDAAVLVQDLRATDAERLVEAQWNLQAAGIAQAGVVRNLVQPRSAESVCTSPTGN